MFNLFSVDSPRRWKAQASEPAAPSIRDRKELLEPEPPICLLKLIGPPSGYSEAQAGVAVESIRPKLEGLMSVYNRLVSLEEKTALLRRGVELRDEELRKNFEPCQESIESRVAVYRDDGKGRVFVGWRIFRDGKEFLPEGVTDDR